MVPSAETFIVTVTGVVPVTSSGLATSSTLVAGCVLAVCVQVTLRTGRLATVPFSRVA